MQVGSWKPLGQPYEEDSRYHKPECDYKMYKLKSTRNQDFKVLVYPDVIDAYL